MKRFRANQIVLPARTAVQSRHFRNSQLQDSSNPYDPFALHKAALIACGIIPYREQISVEEVTKNLGSGLYLSTQVIHIPRGSGLGTSSILAGACVKAIYRMLGKELSQEELYNRVLCMEQIMSTGGGWQDQVGGLAAWNQNGDQRCSDCTGNRLQSMQHQHRDAAGVKRAILPDLFRTAQACKKPAARYCKPLCEREPGYGGGAL